MKNITQQFPDNKVTGIYRIFTKIGKHDFCFVSYAENIYGSIKEHRNEITKHFNGSKLTGELLNNYAMPVKKKALFHFAIFITAKLNDLCIEDIKYEILEITETVDEFELDTIEQKWINKLKCQKYGFNSAFKYLEKFVEATMYNMESKLEYYRKAWAKSQVEIIEDFSKHDQNHINNKKWFTNPTNAFILLDRGYIKDPDNWFKKEWKLTFDKIKNNCL